MKRSWRAERVAARMRVLPRTVEPWMLFTDAGELRLSAYAHGGLADLFHGWTITYDTHSRTYRARCGTLASTGWSRKADLYRWCRDNSQTGGQP